MTPTPETPASGATPGSDSSHGSSSGGSSGGLAARDTICAFWLGSRCYGISTALVGEVVLVEDAAPVPLSPPAVLGVFNLRGAPVALVDTARVLDLPGAGASLPAAGHSATALVIRRASTILAGLLIDRMDSVIGLEQGAFTPRDWAAEHAAVGGFLELAARKLVITLFDSNAVVERIHALKYR